MGEGALHINEQQTNSLRRCINHIQACVIKEDWTK